MKIFKSKILILALMLVSFSSLVYSQGSTTSSMNGKVMSPSGETLPGANIIAIHTATGAEYSSITNVNGYYNLQNLSVGGPYTITVSFVGFESFVKTGIYLNLGQTFRLDVTMSETAIDIEEVIVSAKKVQDFRIIDGNRTGAETVIGRDQLNALPTINRDLSDITRLTPQANVDDYGGVSIAGVNNRYNSISIDGAINNDVFGLSATGTNGGQTGGTPFSMDAIEQFQVVLAPYDVRFSGFAGAGINAVTRSGTNRIEGSAYYYLRNETLAGETPTNVTDVEDDREKLPDFKSETYGFRVGGPIIKNKLFYFASVEIQRDNTPQPFNFDNYEGNSTQAEIDNLSSFLNTTYGYNTGSYLNNSRKLESEKLFFRLDWNINSTHKLMIRHSYSNNEAIRIGASSDRSINFYNYAEYFPSVTNSSAIELKSNWNEKSNNLTIGYTTVTDDRDPYGQNFPSVRISDGSGAYIYFGSEPYSTANKLDQSVLSLTDNFTINKGVHTITIGTSNELSSTYNLFMRKNFGEYRYSNLDDFINGNSAYQYERGYSLIPGDITGDGAEAAAEFSMLQLGLYAQDEIQVSDNLKVTAGIRFDMPMFLDKPREDEHFNTVTAPMIEAAGYDLEGAKAGEMPKSQILISPRVGFNWDALGDQSLQVRGGVGIFTSRLPLVWPGGSYTNNGVNIGGVYYQGDDIVFEPDWENQYENSDFGGTDAPYGGQVDLFAEDFKFPQMFRVNLAVDKKLPWNMIGTLEGIYSKTLNNVLYYNVNMEMPSGNLTGADTRPTTTGDEIDPDYTRVILGTNTGEGYTYNITAQLQKPFDNGLTASLAYTYGRAMAVNDATSSQNSSQWRYMEQVNGLNDLDLSYSDFDLKHRITGYVSYSKEFLGHLKSTLSIFYNGQTGMPFSYIYYGDINGDGERTNSLIYVPANAGEINLVDIGTFGDDDYVSASQQWQDLQGFINNDDYLRNRKGEYAERNAARAPFEHSFDLKFAQDIFTDVADRSHKLTLTLDIFNFTNLLNKDWGRQYYVGNASYTLVDFEGFAADGTTPQYTFEKPDDAIDIYTADDSGVSSSRWQMRFGIRYTF